MNKATKFAELIYNEIGKNYAMEGKTFDQEIVSMQSQVIAEELCKYFSSLTADDLSLLLGICRKQHGRITYTALAKTYESREWAIEVTEHHKQLREKETLMIANSSPKRIPDELWRAIFWSETTKLCKRYQQGEWPSKYEYEDYMNKRDFEGHIWNLHAEAQANGLTPDNFKVNIQVGSIR